MKLGDADETQFLETVAQTYKTCGSMQDQVIRSLAIRTFKRFLHPSGRALELGCDDGYMTSLIAPLVDHLTVVDGSIDFIDLAKKRGLTNVTFVHSLFEDYSQKETYDYVFGTYILEHVRDAVRLLRQAGSLLKANGKLFLVVPNARAMSRQLARHMGLMDDLYSLTQNDIDHGHRRVYDRARLDRDIIKAGLEQVSQGGLMLKPFADFQMNSLFNNHILGDEQIDGLYKMGMEYPDFSGSLFSICTNSPQSTITEG